MKLFHLNGDIFDLDQVIAKDVEADCVRITFRNGDQIPIHWRDPQERLEVLRTIECAAVS